MAAKQLFLENVHFHFNYHESHILNETKQLYVRIIINRRRKNPSFLNFCNLIMGEKTHHN